MSLEHHFDLIKAAQRINPRCPICEDKYEARRIQILNETEKGILSYFSCHKCGASFVAAVVETPFGHVASGLLTDLSSAEVLKFAHSEPVDYDDVLEVHETLQRGNDIVIN